MFRRDICKRYWRSRRRREFEPPRPRFGGEGGSCWALEADFAFDAADAQVITRVPLALAALLGQPVFRVFTPPPDRFKAVPIGNGDAQAVGAASAFNAQESRLLRCQLFHPRCGGRIAFAVLIGAVRCEDNGVKGRSRRGGGIHRDASEV